jgi:hypothetical protein
VQISTSEKICHRRRAILASFAGKERQFTKAVADWSEAYAQRAREDHRLFAEAFRNGEFPGLPA